MLTPANREAWCAVGLAAASIFCMGGVIFGIASMYPVLYFERALEASSCSADIVSVSCVLRRGDKCCEDQQLQYTFMSSIALFVADGSMLVFGEISDRLGPRMCYGVGASLAWLGMVLLGVGARVGSDACWYLATFAIGASGPGVFMGCLMLGEKYPELHGVISAVAASMWDASALVFMIFNGVYFATANAHERPVLGLDVIAFSWLGLTVPLGLLTLRVIPSLAEVHQLRGRGEGASDVTSDDQGDTRALTGAVDDSTDNMGSPPPSAGRGVPPTPTFASFFFRADTVLLLGFMSVMNLKSSLYITTFAEEAALLFPSSLAQALATTFNLAFPLGGFLTSVLEHLCLPLGSTE